MSQKPEERPQQIAEEEEKGDQNPQGLIVEVGIADN